MQYPALLARTPSILINVDYGPISKDIVFPSIFTLSSWMTPLTTYSFLKTSLFTISSLLMLHLLPWRCHSSHFLPCRKTQARSSQTCGWSYAVCRASNGEDSRQKFPHLYRKLCRTRTGEAAGRLKPKVHRTVHGAMQRQHWWRLEPEVHRPVEEALQVQDWWSCRKTQAWSSL